MARKAMAAIGDQTRRRVAPRQMDLFGGALADRVKSAPSWPDLPEDAQEALVGLMRQLILEHARVDAALSAAAEASHDR